MMLAELHVYPLKGARGIALERADVLASGLRHDRRFMLLDAQDRFLTQREYPSLALVTTALTATSLVVGAAGGSAEISLSPATRARGARRTVRIWDDDVEAAVVDGEAATLLSDHLGTRCTLVFMPSDVIRPVESRYAAPGDHVGFADGYPVLLATKASLADLNARLASPVPMNRFRPNLVVEGGEAFEEDRSASVRVGGMTFRMPKRCARCPVPNVDQATGATSKEPIRTLSSYRTVQNKVYFAQNLIPDGEGSLAIGDAVSYFGLAAT